MHIEQTSVKEEGAGNIFNNSSISFDNCKSERSHNISNFMKKAHHKSWLNGNPLRVNLSAISPINVSR